MEETQEEGGDDDDNDDDGEDDDAERKANKRFRAWHLRHVRLQTVSAWAGLVSLRASARQRTTPFQQLGLPARS
jgi:hypothetical protein